MIFRVQVLKRGERGGFSVHNLLNVSFKLCIWSKKSDFSQPQIKMINLFVSSPINMGKTKGSRHYSDGKRANTEQQQN